MQGMSNETIDAVVLQAKQWEARNAKRQLETKKSIELTLDTIRKGKQRNKEFTYKTLCLC